MLYNKIIALIIIAIISINKPFAQYVQINDDFYLAQDIYAPVLQQKNDLKFALNYATFTFPNTIVFNYKIAHSPLKNIAYKLNFRHNKPINRLSDFAFVFKLNEINIGIGYYNNFSFKKDKIYFNHKKNTLEKIYNNKKLSRLNWRNNWRIKKGKKAKQLNKKYLQIPKVYYAVFVNFCNSSLQGLQNLDFNTGYFERFNIADYKLTHYNLDFSLGYITKWRFSFQYSFRVSNTFAKVVFNSNEDNLVTNILNQIDKTNNFTTLTSNYKVVYNAKKLSCFFKLNNLNGFRDYNINTTNQSIKFKDFSQNTSYNIGVNFNLENIFKL